MGRGLLAAGLLIVFLNAGWPLPDGPMEGVLAGIPGSLRAPVGAALERAGGNRAELIAALAAAAPAEREGVAFLIAYMPQRDLAALTAEFLVKEAALAYRARAQVPWGAEIPDELFLNDVLPYAQVNERRDACREEFQRRFLPLVAGCRTPGEAALKLNETIFAELGVEYHATRRRKPDQSPYESIELGYASCTGLSILLADACRAVAVPARLAGTPSWVSARGNHTWVEVWDGQWRFLGAAEPGPFDQAWFVERAGEADPESPRHRIYAASFRATGLAFPLVWARHLQDVHAVDVTRCYTHRRPVAVRLLDRAGGEPVQGRLVLRRDGRLVAAGELAGDREWILAGGLPYTAEIMPAGGGERIIQEFTAPDEGDAEVTLLLRE